MAQDLLENTLLRLKSLEIKFDDLEGDVLSHGTYFAEIETDHEEDRDKVEKLKERVAHIEWDLQPGLEKRFEVQQEELISQLADADREYEEKFRVLNVQNEELRSHLNMTIDALNNISRILNSLIEQKKISLVEVNEVTTSKDDIQVNEVTASEDDNQAQEEDEQLTLSQVYAMYQSQPQDEEGWLEMTNTIKAAEEYEEKQGVKVNGLTQDQWNDLLNM